MFAYIREKYVAFRQYFYDSETIILARAQMVLGLVAVGLGAIEYQTLLGMERKYAIGVGLFMFTKGVIDELARRYRSEDL